MEQKKRRAKEEWKERLARAQTAYSAERSKMDERESYYTGNNKIKAVTRNGVEEKTPHVRNICAELIEAQVDSSIPAPKVTARRQQDVEKAKLIEDMLRNEIDRMRFEEMNDMGARTVPIQGGNGWLVEWDHNARTHHTVGEVTVSLVHPKRIVPQDGIYTGISDMDYIFVLLPQTRGYIERKYGVSVEDEAESDPDIKGPTGEDAAEDLVTQCIAYYKNDNGSIGLYSWVNEIELEDLPDYQARLREGEDGTREALEYEEIMHPMKLNHMEIPGPSPVEMAVEGEVDEFGQPVMQSVLQPVRVPYYKPNIYPLILQKNVSVFGKFLGDSDIDKIMDQQNTINRVEKKILDKMVSGGSYLTLPPSVRIETDNETELKVIRLTNPAEASYMNVYDVEGDISQSMAYLAQVYEESRQIIGVTDSFQGRADTTATSGKAKEFAAAQTAGRLESKRSMKNAAYASLYEAIFKFRLAYTDEPFPVRREDENGNVQYVEFNRWDFLERDDAGEYWWNDMFLFSTDPSSSLASNREAMWQETRLNFTSGSFGNPQDISTLILFWTKMEILHYPGAAETKRYLENKLKEQMTQQQMAQQMEQMNAMRAMAAERENEPQDVRAVIEQAKADAARDAVQKRRGALKTRQSPDGVSI